MNVSNDQIAKIRSEAKFEFFNTARTFDEIFNTVIEKLRAAHVHNTAYKAAEISEKFHSLDQE